MTENREVVRAGEPKIQNLVMSLNAMGIKTWMSCEGHPNRLKTGYNYGYSKEVPDGFAGVPQAYKGPWVCDSARSQGPVDRLVEAVKEFNREEKFGWSTLTNNGVSLYPRDYVEFVLAMRESGFQPQNEDIFCFVHAGEAFYQVPENVPQILKRRLGKDVSLTSKFDSEDWLQKTGQVFIKYPLLSDLQGSAERLAEFLWVNHVGTQTEYKRLISKE